MHGRQFYGLHYFFPYRQKIGGDKDAEHELNRRANDTRPAGQHPPQQLPYLLAMMSNGIPWTILHLLPEGTDVLAHERQRGHPFRKRRHPALFHDRQPSDGLPDMMTDGGNNKS